MTSTGLQLAINGPTATQVDDTLVGWSNSSTLSTAGVGAYETYPATTSSGTTRRMYEIYGVAINGGTAGTFALRLRSETTGHEVSYHPHSGWLDEGPPEGPFAW